MAQAYSIQWLKEKQEAGERLKFLFFWGHTGQEEVGKSCLSQWYPLPFEVEGLTYKTCEHWMMAQKALLFGDEETRLKIVESKTPKEAKALGRQVKNFDNQVWDANKYEIVKQGNAHKFGQNPKFAEYLQGTSNRIIVEASPVDAIWGIGMAQDHAQVENAHAWRGENLLGFALMEVRDGLG